MPNYKHTEGKQKNDGSWYLYFTYYHPDGAGCKQTLIKLEAPTEKELGEELTRTIIKFNDRK